MEQNIISYMLMLLIYCVKR